MSRYKIIDYIKKGNMLVARDEDEAIGIAIVIEQIIHRTTISAEMDAHIVEELEQCGQVIFFYEDDIIHVSSNHLGGNLVAINPFRYSDTHKHGDFSFTTLVETAIEFGAQIDEIEDVTGETLSDEENDLLEELLSLREDGDENIKEQLESMISKVSHEDADFGYDIEINSIKDLLEEVYGNVNHSIQTQKS